MSNTAQKRQREKEMVSQMIALYCLSLIHI